MLVGSNNTWIVGLVSKKDGENKVEMKTSALQKPTQQLAFEMFLLFPFFLELTSLSCDLRRR